MQEGTLNPSEAFAIQLIDPTLKEPSSETYCYHAPLFNTHLSKAFRSSGRNTPAKQPNLGLQSSINSNPLEGLFLKQESMLLRRPKWLAT